MSAPAVGREPLSGRGAEEADDGVVVYVVTGGEPISSEVLVDLPPPSVVLAADSGLDQARAIGLEPNLLVGDLDSVSPAGVAWAHDVGIPIERHPVDKDATDLELALTLASRAADRVVVLGGGGGRTDHLLANLLLLASPAFAGVRVDARLGAERITVVHHRRALSGTVGSLVTLVPVHGPAEGVSTRGLRWPLQDETLVPGTSRGVSNELTSATATVELRRGVLVVLQPD